MAAKLLLPLLVAASLAALAAPAESASVLVCATVAGMPVECVGQGTDPIATVACVGADAIVYPAGSGVLVDVCVN